MLSKDYPVVRTDSSLPYLPWNQAYLLSDFMYPWRENNPPKTEFRALRDEHKFYFLYKAEDPSIKDKIEKLKRNHIRDCDRVEIFFKRDDDLNPYYCLEIDPLGRVMDFEGRFYRNSNHDWNWPAGHLEINASSDDLGYTVEGSITFQSLRDLSLLQNDTLQAGLYRCHYVNNNPTWIAWVKPDSEKPDFHIPSSFGTLTLITD